MESAIIVLIITQLQCMRALFVFFPLQQCVVGNVYSVEWAFMVHLLFAIIWHYLKTLDTIGNCQRLVFTVGSSQQMHWITNLWKFELNRSPKLRDINERKNTIVAPWLHKVVCFQMLDFETSNSKSEVSKSNSWKITSLSSSRKLRHFRGSCFSQCFILSTSPHYS